MASKQLLNSKKIKGVITGITSNAKPVFIKYDKKNLHPDNIGLGTMGAGMSFKVKREINDLSNKQNILIVDPESEINS